MVSIEKYKGLLVGTLMIVLSACSSSGGGAKQKAQATVEKEPVNIYSQLNHDQIENRVEEKELVKGSPEWVQANTEEIRNLYFHKQFEEAKILGEKTLKLAPASVEIYYWLARIGMDQADFQVAFDQAQKGIGFSKPKDQNMRKALEEIRDHAQMGAN